MKKILITGAEGQLGLSIAKIAKAFPHFELVTTDIAALDITDRASIKSKFMQGPIDGLINCAAYTAVDKAEEEKEKAYAINSNGPGNLALACLEFEIPLIHVSTDYVFSGKTHLPYRPADPIDPQSIYAKSKAGGEVRITDTNPEAVIVRTSWLYSEFGENFVKTMLRLGKERTELGVIYDQIGSPTYASDLALALLTILDHISDPSKKNPKQQIYHFANSGSASWFDLSTNIIQLAKLDCQIKPIPTTAYPLPATRPFYSVLDCHHIREEFAIPTPYWRSSLQQCLTQLNS